MKFKTLCLIVALARLANAAELVWIEAEQFRDYGGWVNDSQFIDQMGSPYLLANGLGVPVTDAVTRVTLPRAGRWRLWVRDRDWVPEHHPGKFQVLVNGTNAGPTFGASGKAGWLWEDGGVHEWSGEIEIRLHDLAGFYGRCDAIVLAADANWTPPADLPALREQYGGVSRAVKNAGDYDVVVVGGGLAGCMAATAAARGGARTVLIQDRPVLGGNGSTEIMVPPVGIFPSQVKDPRDPRETGIIEEAGLEGRQQMKDTRYWSSRLKRIVTAEPNLTLVLNTHATGVAANAGAITAVFTVETRTGQRSRFGGKIFVDCTGDGVVGVAAGAAYRVGREPRSMYNESMAPEVGNLTTMGNSLKYYAESTGGPAPFASPVWARPFLRCEDFPPQRHPPHLGPDISWQWNLELGGTRDTYREKEEIRDDVLRLMYGIWDHVKNHCPRYREQAADYKLTWVGYVAGVRESRRLLGDYVFTENDVVNQTLFPDRVAFGGWGIDDHFSEGWLYRGSPARHPHKGLVHSVPLRSLYSTNVVNLLMAGRDISTSHVGMGTTRVMMTCAVIGQAAGTAAALCVDHQTTPRGIYQSYLEELQQQLLKDGAYIVGLPNNDPRDLARSATVTASSAAEGFSATNVLNGIARVADGRNNAWQADTKQHALHWLELAWPQPQTFNVVHVTFFTRSLAPVQFTVEAWAGNAWLPVANVAKKLRRHTLALERTTTTKLRLVLPEAAGVCEVRVYDEPARLVEIARHAENNQAQPDRDAGFPWETFNPAVKYAGILIEAGNAQIIGEWQNSNYAGPSVGNGYLHDGDKDKGAKQIIFHPVLEKAGSYEIRLAYAPFKNRSTKTPVIIRTGDVEKTVSVNQRLTPAINKQFHSLGRFDLVPGATITISNAGTDGYVVVDALQLVP